MATRNISLAVGVYTTRQGSDALVAFTNAKSMEELPEMTNEKLTDWFGIVNSDLKEEDIDVTGHCYEVFEWQNLIPLSDIPII